MQTVDQTGVDWLFAHVVGAVDDTPVSVEAARQVEVLTPPDRTLHLVTAVGAAALSDGWGAGYSLSAGDWERRVAAARSALPGRRTVQSAPVLHSGPVAAALVDELARRQASLIAVGSHDHHRLPGIVSGSVAIALVHDAPCSVLVARFDDGRPRRFRAVAVGVDGSPSAAAALEVARVLAARLPAQLTVLTADGAQPSPVVPGATMVSDPRPAVEVLREPGADLLVVGSRGLHGLRALGSVSERVAATSTVSVLVVRAG